MKALDDLALPEDIKYFEEHTWAKEKGELVVIGVTDYAQDNLGEVIFIDLPENDETFEKGEQFGAVESAKSVSELYMPVGGTVVSVNGDLEDDPGKINSAPYGAGWLIEVRPADPGEVETLQTRAQYLEMLAGMERVE